MAKSLSYKLTKTEALSIKGELSSDGKDITYIGEDKLDHVITVEDIIDRFVGKPISLAIKIQTDEELPIE